MANITDSIKSLRTVLIISVMLGLMIVTGIFTTVFITSTVINNISFSNEVMNHVAEKFNNHIKGDLSKGIVFVKTYRESFLFGENGNSIGVDNTNFTVARKYTYNLWTNVIVKDLPIVTGFFIGQDSYRGECMCFIGFVHGEEEGQYLEWKNNNNMTFDESTLYANGSRKNTFAANPWPYDTRWGPWWIFADAAWPEVTYGLSFTDDVHVTDHFPGNIYIGCTTGIKDKNGNMAGYSNFNMHSNAITTFLAKEAASSSLGISAFVIERASGFIISTSDETIKGAYVEDGKIKRRDGFLTDLPGAVEATTHLQNKFGKDYSSLQNDYAFETKSHYVRVKMTRGENIRGIDWFTVNLFPKSYFINNMLITAGVFLGVGLLLIIISTIIICIGSHVVTKPITGLAKQMEVVKTMQLDQVDKSKTSYFSEIKRIQYSFYEMIDKISTYRGFIPDHILVSLEKGKKPEKKKDAKKVVPTLNDEVQSQSGTSQTASYRRLSSRSLKSIKSRFSSGLFAIGLSNKSCTLVTIKLNTNERLKREPAQGVVKQHSELLSSIRNIIKKKKGVITSFDSETIRIIWNGVVTNKNHKRLAFESAEKIKVLLKDSAFKKFVIGVTIGDVSIGNMGNDQSKALVVVGDPVELLNSLVVFVEERGLMEEGLIVSDEESIEDCGLYTYRLIQPFNINKRKGHVCEIGLRSTMKDDEWLYEMAQLEKLKKWDKFNDGYREYVSKNYEEATESLKNYLDTVDKDTVAESLLETAQNLEPISVFTVDKNQVHFIRESSEE
mmetsp:Transcript_3872/g.5727  ORF Transcript_3872/g.5727 Transcript_3872/m.5727 type:complete len:781 (+) Transcript_3872:32-2374(+)